MADDDLVHLVVFRPVEFISRYVIDDWTMCHVIDFRTFYQNKFSPEQNKYFAIYKIFPVRYILLKIGFGGIREYWKYYLVRYSRII